MKISIIVQPDSIQQTAVEALMAEARLRETSRIVIGGDKSPLHYVITYEGAPDHYNLFADSIYIEIEDTKSARPEDWINQYSTFFSLACLNGYRCQGLKRFKEFLKQTKKK